MKNHSLTVTVLLSVVVQHVNAIEHQVYFAQSSVFVFKLNAHYWLTGVSEMENRANGWWESLCSVLVTHWLWLKEEGWCDEIQVLLDREMIDCQRMKNCCAFRGDLRFYLVGLMSTDRGLIIMWLNEVHNSDFKRKLHKQLVSGCLLFCHVHILPILTSTPWNICLKKRPLILIACLCLTPAGKGCSWEGMKDEEENFM